MKNTILIQFIFSILFIGYSGAENHIFQLSEFSQGVFDSNLLCGSWKLIKITETRDKTIYHTDGKSQMTFDCEFYTYQITENSEVTAKGEWTFNEADQEITTFWDGVTRKGKLLKISKQTLVLSFEGSIFEYVKVQQ